jgi:hypothetical protein
MDQPPILFTREGALAHITLNRPARRKAIGGGMGEALDAAFAALAEDRSVRVVLLSGTGGHFCAGLDLTEVAAGDTPEQRLAAQQARNRSIGARFEAISRLPQVVVASIAQGSSAVADWIGEGRHSKRLSELQRSLQIRGLEVDAVVWHQGETEAWSGADAVAYEKNLRRWIDSVRSLGIQAPIYVCLTSRDGEGVINPAIRQAQASVWNRKVAVYAGPDTDSLDGNYRSDGVHFNGRGLEAFAVLLHQAMTSRSDLQAPRWAVPVLDRLSR